MDNGVPDDEKKGMTLTRTIMNLTLSVQTAGAGSVFSYGLVMVEDDAAASLSFPDPDDLSQDPGWVWREGQMPVFSSTVNDFSQSRLIRVDTRAQRKYIGEDFAFMLIMHVAAGGASTVNIDGWVRTLFKRA